MAATTITTPVDPIEALVSEWLKHDAIMDKLSDEEFYVPGLHPSFSICTAIERQVKHMKPMTTGGRIARHGLMRHIRGD